MRFLLLLVGFLSTAEWALAESHSRADPADPRAPAPPPRYQSAFPDYQPFVEQKNSWKQVNQEVADNPAMGSMQHKPGMTMPGMDAKAGDGATGKEGAGSHDMGSMKGKPGGVKPGMDKPAASAPKAKESVGGHDMSTMKDKPGGAMPAMGKPAASAPKSKEGSGGHDMRSMHHMPSKTTAGDKKAPAAPMTKEGHDTMAMAKPQTAPSQPANAQTGRITGTGTVQLIDKVNGRVKLTHDPIAAMGWPRMTLFLRLKESSLADQVKEGDKVEFYLEKSSSGYVISGFQRPSSESGSGRKPAGHSGH